MFLATVFELVIEVLHCMRGRDFYARIIDLPFGLVVKTTSTMPRGAAQEAEIIRFVQRHTSIPTPRVVASATGYGHHYLLMKKVAGENLQRVWPTLEPAQRTRIVEQLRAFISQLRSLPSPHGRAVCSLNGAPLRDFRITGEGPVGPFADEEAFNDRLVETSAPFYKRATRTEFRARMRGDHSIVFTHGDIAPRNIMVDGDAIVALLDWEQAGWYPEHWELVKAMRCPPYPEAAGQLWVELVNDMFENDYEAEWAVERDLSERIVGPI
ncbi:hypothetical protein VTO73DRAFT_3380 [Trametes versicolor]